MPEHEIYLQFKQPEFAPPPHTPLKKALSRPTHMEYESDFCAANESRPRSLSLGQYQSSYSSLAMQPYANFISMRSPIPSSDISLYNQGSEEQLDSCAIPVET